MKLSGHNWIGPQADRDCAEKPFARTDIFTQAFHSLRVNSLPGKEIASTPRPQDALAKRAQCLKYVTKSYKNTNCK